MPLFNPLGSWLAPVADFASLPLVGNTIGDTIVTTDDNTIYTWNGTNWVAPAANASIIVHPGTNNLAFDSEISATVPVGGSVPLCPIPVLDGDGSFTITDALTLANANGIGRVQMADGVFVGPPSNQYQMYENVELVGNGVGTLLVNRPSLALLPSIITGGAETESVFRFKKTSGGFTNRALAVTPAQNDNPSFLQVSPAVAALVSENDWIEYNSQFRRVQRKFDDTGASGNWFLILNAHVRLGLITTPSSTFDHHAASNFIENSWCKDFKLKLFADGWQNIYLSAFEFEHASWSGHKWITYEGDEFGPGVPNYAFYGLWSAVECGEITSEELTLEKSATAWCYGFKTSHANVIRNTINNHSGPDGFGGDNPQWCVYLDPGCDQWIFEGNKIEIGIDSAFGVGLLYHTTSSFFESIILRNNSWTASGIVNGVVQESHGLWFDDITRVTVNGDVINAGSADVLVGGKYTILCTAGANPSNSQDVEIVNCKLAPTSGFSGPQVEAPHIPSIGFHSSTIGWRRYKVSGCSVSDFQKTTDIAIDMWSGFLDYHSNTFRATNIEGTAGGHDANYNFFGHQYNALIIFNSAIAVANMDAIQAFGVDISMASPVTFTDEIIRITNCGIAGDWTIDASMFSKYIITGFDKTTSFVDNSGIGVVSLI